MISEGNHVKYLHLWYNRGKREREREREREGGRERERESYLNDITVEY